MNSLLVIGKENAEKHADAHSCYYCRKAFSNHRALGGHLRIHQTRRMPKRSMNSPRFSSNSAEITGIKPNLLVNCQPENSPKGYRKILPFFNGESSPLGFSKRFCPCETGLADASKFSGSNLADAKPEFFMSPNLSSPSGSSEIHFSNYLSSTVTAASNVAGTTSLSEVAPLARCLSDSSYFLGMNEAYQFNNDAFQTWKDDTPFSYGDFLQNHQFYDLNKIPYPAFAVSHPYLGLGSNPSTSFKETTIDSFPQDSYECFGLDEAGQSNNKDVSTCGGNKRPYLGDIPGDVNMTNASKRPKNNSLPPMPPKKPKKKELLLLKAMERSFSAMGISFDAEEEEQADLDLSLHL